MIEDVFYPIIIIPNVRIKIVDDEIDSDYNLYMLLHFKEVFSHAIGNNQRNVQEDL